MINPNEMTPRGKTYAEIIAEEKLKLEEVNLALEKHRISGARWWEYLVSHCTFTLVVGDALARDGNVVLCFPATESVSGPVNWQRQKLNLEFLCDLNLEKWAPRYILKDEKVGFYLESRGFMWRENYDVREHGNLYFGEPRR